MWISQENGNSRRAQSDKSPSSPRPQASDHSLKLPKFFRILKRSDFKEIRQGYPRFYGNALIITYRPSTHPKLGITVSRAFGKSHERNHFKRLVREAFRLHRHTLPPYAMVVHPQRGLTTPTLPTITHDFLSLAKESR